MDGVPPFRPPRHPCFYLRRHWTYTCRAAVWYHTDPTWPNGCTHLTTQCSGSDELRTPLMRIHVTFITHTSTSTECKNTCPFGHQPMDPWICAQRWSIKASSITIFWSLPSTPETRQIFHTGHEREAKGSFCRSIKKKKKSSKKLRPNHHHSNLVPHHPHHHKHLQLQTGLRKYTPIAH